MRAIQSLVLLLLLTANITYSSRTNETDRLALLAFKKLITEDPLGHLSSWNESTGHCEWSGVTCGHKHNRVTVLDMRSKGLAGSLSPSLGNLSFLHSLLIQDNHFKGNIPDELSSLFRLQIMNFTNNAIQGEIPTNFSSCRQLIVFSGLFNDLVGKIPSSFGMLSRLSFLELFSNNLIGEIPPSLVNLTLLRRLTLGTNSLTGTIPNSIGQLTKLVYFGIGLNQLSGDVPPSLYNITTLTNLVIPLNQLSGSIPSDIGITLPNLRVISTGGNKFQGPFPDSLSNSSQMRILDLSNSSFHGSVPSNLVKEMTYLRWLNLGYNNLGDLGFLYSLTNCTFFQILSIFSNNFRGNLPGSITNLSVQLTQLIAGGNQISGTIPAEISMYENLIILDLESNNLSGFVPKEIGRLKSLSSLSINGNNLSGTIPFSVGNLTQMYELYLQENNFRGTIPSSIMDISGLQNLNLSYNSLEGSIPKTLGLIPVLTFINLAHNSFSGSLPLEIGNSENLQELDVSNNEISGQIPTTLGSCPKLEQLLLNGNAFQGSIPTSLSSLKGIQVLDLSHNNLSGQIPRVLETIKSLKKMNLSINGLTGEVPSLGVFKNMTRASLFGNKDLCGGVPQLHLQRCPNHTSGRNHHQLRNAILIACLVTSSALVLVSVILLRKRQHKKSPAESTIGKDFIRVSYDQLNKATDGFSSANMIGAGSYGSVYKGVLPQDQKPVAIKVIHLDRRGASKSFIAECEALRETRHRNLLRTLTVCSSVTHSGEDFKALVFEYMPNGSVESWLHPTEEAPERNLDLGQRLNIAIDIASALEYLHQRGEKPIIHCDLKPSNVLLDEDMTARVGDFGLSRFLSVNSSEQTDSLAIKGSIGYVPPEYGLGGQISAEGDIYSYGILLLEMATGKRPTDEMFTDGMNLHKFCWIALPDRAEEVADSRLLLTEPSETPLDAQEDRLRREKLRACLVSLTRVGVACAVESPSERMDIGSVLLGLIKAKEVFFGVGIHGRMPLATNEGTSGS